MLVSCRLVHNKSYIIADARYHMIYIYTQYYGTRHTHILRYGEIDGRCVLHVREIDPYWVHIRVCTRYLEYQSTRVELYFWACGYFSKGGCVWPYTQLPYRCDVFPSGALTRWLSGYFPISGASHDINGRHRKHHWVCEKKNNADVFQFWQLWRYVPPKRDRSIPSSIISN